MTTDKSSTGTRVLVAEDNLTNQKVIAMMLSRFGVVPVVVDDGQKALELGIEFYRSERVKNEAAKKIVARIQKETGLPMHFGKRVTVR